MRNLCAAIFMSLIRREVAREREEEIERKRASEQRRENERRKWGRRSGGRRERERHGQKDESKQLTSLLEFGRLCSSHHHVRIVSLSIVSRAGE